MQLSLPQGLLLGPEGPIANGESDSAGCRTRTCEGLNASGFTVRTLCHSGQSGVLPYAPLRGQNRLDGEGDPEGFDRAPEGRTAYS